MEPMDDTLSGAAGKRVRTPPQQKKNHYLRPLILISRLLASG